MASEQHTVEFLSEQMAGAGTITCRKMFGEYALYCDGKVFAFVCDDQLYIKPTEAGKSFLKNPTMKPAYPGSKDYFWIDTEYWDDDVFLTRLVTITVADLPAPKKKNPRF